MDKIKEHIYMETFKIKSNYSFNLSFKNFIKNLGGTFKMKEFMSIGQITKPHGVRGEVKVFSLTDSLEEFTTLKKGIYRWS